MPPLGSGSRHSKPFFKEGLHMSRVVTPLVARPANTPAPVMPAHTTASLPYEKIAARAYEKWVKRGRPHGTDKQDWIEAEAELKAEVSKTSGATATSRGR